MLPEYTKNKVSLLAIQQYKKIFLIPQDLEQAYYPTPSTIKLIILQENQNTKGFCTGFMLKNSEIYSYIVGSHFMGINTLFEHYYQAS